MEPEKPDHSTLYAVIAAVVGVCAMAFLFGPSAGNRAGLSPADSLALAQRDSVARAQRELMAHIGERPRISQADGGIFEVEVYLKAVANDPESIDVASCSEPVATASGWATVCTYYGNNLFGGKVRQDGQFVIRQGQVVVAP